MSKADEVLRHKLDEWFARNTDDILRAVRLGVREGVERSMPMPATVNQAIVEGVREGVEARFSTR